jgi:HemY protein
MARIEGEQHGHTGRVREWLARAVNAPRDPAWAADGVVSDRWAPVSPVTGAFDVFRWRVPVAAVDEPAGALLSARVEALVGLGAGGEPMLADPAKAESAAAFPDVVTAEVITQPAAAPIEAPASLTAPTRPAAVPASAPAEASPIAARAPAERSPPPASVPAGGADRLAHAKTEADDLKERIEQAAERAAAAIAGPKPAVPKPAVPKTAPPKPAAAKAPPAAPERPRNAGEPKIFVPPRAPDDPGPDPTGATDDGVEFGPFRPSGAKA